MKLVGYTRVSDKEQVKRGYSLEAQEESIRAFCAENNHRLVKVFVEPGRSGSKEAAIARPTFQQTIRFTMAGGCEGMVVKWMDRFARNVLDFLHVWSDFYKHDKNLFSISEPLLNGDPTDPITRYMATSIMAAYELQAGLSGLKAAQGRERRAKQGNYPGSVPIGYQRIERKIVPDPERSEMIARAFFEFSTGRYTLETWTDEARERGHVTRRGKPLNKGQWYRVLRNTFYVGRYTWKESEYVGDYEPIVSEEMFQAVQEMLDAAGPGPAKKHHFWMLSGLLWSDVHHRTMIGAMIKKKYGYYRAAGKPEHNVPAEEIEGRIEQYLGRVQWTGEPLTLSENWRLAFKVARSMQDIYICLPTKKEQRDFLRLVFFKKGVRVAASGRILETNLRPGFELGEG